VSMTREQIRGRGFTLIELLTVIAIIAVLAAILFPVFSRVREKGRQTNCLSNLQQLGHASTLYSTDYNEFIVPWSITNPGTAPWSPPTGHENEPWPTVATWDISLQSYARNASILICRGNPNSHARTARAYSIAQYTQRPFTIAGSTVISIGGHRDSIPAPTKTVLLFEKGDNPPGAWGDALGQNVYQTHSSEGEAGYSQKMFHFDGKNFLFLDGHAKFYTDGQGPFHWMGAGGTGDDRGPGVCSYWGTVADGGDWPGVDD